MVSAKRKGPQRARDSASSVYPPPKKLTAVLDAERMEDAAWRNLKRHELRCKLCMTAARQGRRCPEGAQLTDLWAATVVRAQLEERGATPPDPPTVPGTRCDRCFTWKPSAELTSNPVEGDLCGKCVDAVVRGTGKVGA